MTDQNAQKRRAVRAAIEWLPESGVIGLGTGSTAELFIEEVAELVRQGRKLTGVPTSRRSQALAERLQIPLLDDGGPWSIDVCVDGADEVSDDFDLIKGGGACHLREKIVNASAKVNIIVVDQSKVSHRLGERWAVPVEVATFGHLATAKHLSRFGTVTPRSMSGTTDARLVTDSGNYIYDVKTGPIKDPAQLDTELRAIPGVVETGLFVGRTSRLIVAGPDFIREVTRTATD
ncbi:MAG: ribose-5-phosphate isomerase RpiA [Polyangiaceae bacterium]